MKRHLAEDEENPNNNKSLKGRKIVSTSGTAAETETAAGVVGPTHPPPIVPVNACSDALAGVAPPTHAMIDTAAAFDADVTEVQLVMGSIAGFTSMGCLRCVLQHQLYHLISNRTLVDRDVSSLRESGRLRVFQSLAGAVLMRAEDYVADLRAAAAAAPQHSASLRAFEQWVLRFPQSSVLESQLLSGTVGESAPPAGGSGASDHSSSTSPTPSQRSQFALSRDDISALQQQGFLLPRRDADVRALWVHHPRLGMTAANIVAVRLQIVAMARRARFKEVSVRQVAKAKLRLPGQGPGPSAAGSGSGSGSGQWVPFADEFFILDVLGVGQLHEFRAPAGERWLRLER